MSNLQSRQEKIQAKRKQTPWRGFLMEICSRFPLNLYKLDGMISRYPKTQRLQYVIKQSEYEQLDNQLKSELYDDNKNFWEQYQEFRDSMRF